MLISSLAQTELSQYRLSSGGSGILPVMKISSRTQFFLPPVWFNPTPALVGYNISIDMKRRINVIPGLYAGPERYI